MKVSLVIPYYNRPHLLDRLFWSLYHTAARDLDYEIFVVDDTSDQGKQASMVASNFQGMLPVRGLYRREKLSQNAGNGRNVGAKLAQGDILVFSDACLMYLDPIVEKLSRRIESAPNSVISSSCYSLDRDKQFIAEDVDPRDPQLPGNLRSRIELLDQPANRDGEDGWYIHPEYRPAKISTIFALTKDAYMDLGGFDEDFGRYWGFADTDFFERAIRRGMNFAIDDSIVALHQFHYDNMFDAKNRQMGGTVNRQIYEEQKKDRDGWRANEGQEWGIP